MMNVQVDFVFPRVSQSIDHYLSGDSARNHQPYFIETRRTLAAGAAWHGRSKTTCSLVSTLALSNLNLSTEAPVLTSD